MDAFRRGVVFGYDKALTNEQHEKLHGVVSPFWRIEVEGTTRLYDLPKEHRHSDDDSE